MWGVVGGCGAVEVNPEKNSLLPFSFSIVKRAFYTGVTCGMVKKKRGKVLCTEKSEEPFDCYLGGKGGSAPPPGTAKKSPIFLETHLEKMGPPPASVGGGVWGGFAIGAANFAIPWWENTQNNTNIRNEKFDYVP